MSRLRYALAALLGAAGAAGLAACNGIDEGAEPTGIVIRYNGIETGFHTFECASFQLAGILQMEADGQLSEGDITSRGSWTSSNAGVIDVSNGDLETEPGSRLYFPAGTVVARGPGAATIRLDYLGLIATFAVNADPIGGLTITPEIDYLAPGSYQTFALEAQLDDDEPATDITASAVWRIVSGAVPVSIVDTSTVQTQSDPVGSPFALEAQVFTCDRRVQRELTIGAIESLRVVHEQPEGLPVPIDYSDALRVEAVMAGGGAVQNLSGQVEFEQVLGDADEAQLGAGAELLTLSGLKTGRPVQFSIRYAPLDIEVLTRVVTFEELELQTLRISPETLTLRYPDVFRFDALGRFSDGHERSVRRSVTWTSLDTDLLSIVASGADMGEVSGRGFEGVVEVMATATNSEDTLEAEARVEIQVP
jgi:hypothetical protein